MVNCILFPSRGFFSLFKAIKGCPSKGGQENRIGWSGLAARIQQTFKLVWSTPSRTAGLLCGSAHSPRLGPQDVCRGALRIGISGGKQGSREKLGCHTVTTEARPTCRGEQEPGWSSGLSKWKWGGWAFRPLH